MELRIRATLAEARLADLKATLDDMREQRDHWQTMAQRLAITDQRPTQLLDPLNRRKDYPTNGASSAPFLPGCRRHCGARSIPACGIRYPQLMLQVGPAAVWRPRRAVFCEIA